ncbi:unnamed protein product [Colias eurytheme]|nr:unnamed protein product [Colias eurytheme]
MTRAFASLERDSSSITFVPFPLAGLGQFSVVPTYYMLPYVNRHSKHRYMAFLQFLRRNLVSITFPTLAATFIWLDWSHTRKWKALKKE